jgi:subtilase family serine protease
VERNASGGYTVRVTVRNQSGVAVTYGNNFHVTLYVDPSVTPTYDSVYDLSPSHMWGVQGSWFGAGQSRTLETTVNFGSAGAHTLWAWADPYRVVAETSDTNNGRQLVQEITVLSGEGAAEGESTVSVPAPTPTNVP